MIVKNTLVAGVMTLFLFQHCLSDAPASKGSKEIDHSPWTKLLQKHVNEQGFVNYAGFKTDSTALQSYLDLLTSTPPDPAAWSVDAQLAYWINVYNAFTIKLIIDHYPLESIKDIGSKIQIPFVNSPWDIKFIHMNGEKLDLNNVEHSILRKKFSEPRIHFAINCASFSCPKLRREAYLSTKLDEQLEEQAIDFINDPARNTIAEKRMELSKIFDWFKGDFTKDGSLSNFISKYSKTQIDGQVKISYRKYDWSLNDR